MHHRFEEAISIPSVSCDIVRMKLGLQGRAVVNKVSLDLFKPSSSRVQYFLEKRSPRLSSDIKKLPNVVI
ncbi:hypothetical protein HanIR_Chr17g0893551 [Helianthus annuus]|nr:hypothetical protein HanIR_Chr17g0893551 [Helianthus annuus]